MKHEILTHPQKGRLLQLTDGRTQLWAALDYGIRIVHLSLLGKENLFYEQPQDLSDGLTTPQGWRIYGGHRYWTAPESDLSYYPDNAPVDWKITENGALLTQSADPWLGVIKQIEIEFRADGSILLTHSIQNATDAPITCASWGVNTFSGGGRAQVRFDRGTAGSYNPERTMSLWGKTRLNDERLCFKDDHIEAQQLPGKEAMKLGLFCAAGEASFENKGQRFTLTFEAAKDGDYPDGGCNFELYTDANVMELEALGQINTMAPGECNCHTERWFVE